MYVAVLHFTRTFSGNAFFLHGFRINVAFSFFDYGLSEHFHGSNSFFSQRQEKVSGPNSREDSCVLDA